MRIVVVFSDHERYIPRLRPGDMCLIVRDENYHLVIKHQCLCTGLQDNQAEEGTIHQTPILQGIANIDEVIGHAAKINVEIIAHSSRGGKALQTDPTPAYPVQSIALDDLAHWLEKDLLKENTARSTISLLSCEAAHGSKKYPALAEQIFQLFTTKPLKLTARKGFGFIEKKSLSLDTFHTLVKIAVDKTQDHTGTTSRAESIATPILRTYNALFGYPTQTPANEKSVYFLGDDQITYKMDSHAYNLFLLIRNEPPADNPRIVEIVHKAPEKLTRDDIRALARYGNHSENDKLKGKATLVLEGTINSPSALTTDISSYATKQGLVFSIRSLQRYIQTTEECQNKEALSELLSETLSFITYRHVRNYPIENMRALTTLLIDIVMRDGIITDPQHEALARFAEAIQSPLQIDADATHRRAAVGARLPSYFDEIKKVTESKNMAFGEKINDFLNRIRPSAEPPSIK